VQTLSRRRHIPNTTNNLSDEGDGDLGLRLPVKESLYSVVDVTLLLDAEIPR